MADITRRESERGTIQPRRAGRGRGLESLWDWEPFRSLMPGNLGNLMPANLSSIIGIEVMRTEDGYDVEIPVPGFRPEDINVTYQDGVITVTARNERRSMTRAIAVPDDIDEDRIEANVENGILTLRLHQSPERQPKRIAIRGSTGQPSVGSQSASGQPSMTQSSMGQSTTGQTSSTPSSTTQTTQTRRT